MVRRGHRGAIRTRGTCAFAAVGPHSFAFLWGSGLASARAARISTPSAHRHRPPLPARAVAAPRSFAPGDDGVLPVSRPSAPPAPPSRCFGGWP
eukprot:CAMPEP_0180196640 /NCGR_PEP_ID=MMETSP0987-20121128/4217_1 /TAXON_ID=697907 /ORGANISM="non described non described, Strain CCMP2293" /LENGTH=93 /DNA_ID=CAMNT_0022151539 /DNA_START=366 /DNA_END=644 /DNA_ORIENTATION=-